jgi:hypothetical protein
MPWPGPGAPGRAARIPELITHANPEWLAGFGAFGDAELFGDAGKADAFEAQLDKFSNCFLIFHSEFFSRPSEVLADRQVGYSVADGKIFR